MAKRNGNESSSEGKASTSSSRTKNAKKASSGPECVKCGGRLTVQTTRMVEPDPSYPGFMGRTRLRQRTYKCSGCGRRVQHDASEVTAL